MNLWYIAIGLDDKSFSRDYCSEFGYRTRFISNYFSKQIRKHRFKTDGTYNMVHIKCTSQTSKESAIVPIDVLETEISFDQERYERIKGTPDCEYYLDILEEGFQKASKCKEIPLQTLLDLIGEFKKHGYKNEWLHKKKRFKELDLEVVLNCFFTTLDFELVVTVNKISTKEELCAGVVLRTDPDEIHFDHLFKDLWIEENNIIITDFLDRPRYLIDLEKAVNRDFVLSLIPSGLDNDEDDDG